MNPSFAPLTSDPDQKAASLPRPGDVIADRYLVERRLGEGGMGVVYEAVDTSAQRRVALKFLHPEMAGTEDATARFQREAQATRELRGPHIARVYDVCDAPSGLPPYMVMELLRGCDLEAEIRRRGPLPIAEAVDLVMQACCAMSEAHAHGIIHRDLKPSNLFLAQEGERTVLKVLDFGISKLSIDANVRVTQTSTSIGTPLYMSPEQVRSAKYVDPRTDIWSLGVILFEMLAGSPPFFGTATAAIAAIVADATPSLREVRAEVPEALERIVQKALSKNLRDRYPDVRSFALALEPFSSGEVPPPPRLPTPQKLLENEVWRDLSDSSTRVSPGGSRKAARTPARSARSGKLATGEIGRVARKARRAGIPFVAGAMAMAAAVTLSFFAGAAITAARTAAPLAAGDLEHAVRATASLARRSGRERLLTPPGAPDGDALTAADGVLGADESSTRAHVKTEASGVPSAAPSASPPRPVEPRADGTDPLYL
jgi:serine/threonine-protein kinase